MLSQQTIRSYQSISLDKKLQLVLDMCRESTPFLVTGEPDHVARKFALLKRENDLRNQNMLRAIARTRET
jgi:hypothetical protein